MTRLVEVRFKGNRKAYFESADTVSVAPGMAVVVELERGQDLGEVTAVGDLALKKIGSSCDGCSKGAREPSGKVLRQAASHESHVTDELRKTEEDIRRKVIERVAAHGLNMKVSDAEWQWDRKKLTVYFTAEKRVDFRALVRDLASQFRTRIELRQIGSRDEARRLDGVGRCGRRYCCSSWLDELKPVGLSLAKDQRLSLNPSQISGGCGRLLCCLRYEHDFYVSNRKRFPKEGKTLITAAGRERVEAINIFRELITLRSEGGSLRSISLTDLKAEVAATASPPEPDRPPGGLVTFDEGHVEVDDARASEAVAPARRKRSRRRRRGRGKGPDGSGQPTDDNQPGRH